jgi:hypothetical protein
MRRFMKFLVFLSILTFTYSAGAAEDYSADLISSIHNKCIPTKSEAESHGWDLEKYQIACFLKLFGQDHKTPKITDPQTDFLRDILQGPMKLGINFYEKANIKAFFIGIDFLYKYPPQKFDSSYKAGLAQSVCDNAEAPPNGTTLAITDCYKRAANIVTLNLSPKEKSAIEEYAQPSVLSIWTSEWSQEEREARKTLEAVRNPEKLKGILAAQKAARQKAINKQKVHDDFFDNRVGSSR